MATYINNLRLKEIATGDESGIWGISTNTNLSLIADGFSYGTLEVAADSNETFTMPDATANATRGFYLKFTSAGSLTATRTLTLGPNTVSKMWIIENATSGSQSITIKQGSGDTVTIATGAVAFVYTDGAGSGAKVVNAMTSTTFVTPLLGTPASGVATNITGLPLTTGVTGTLPVANGGTGITSFGSGVAAWLGTPSSANLATAVTDETGSGSLVFATSPTFVTPALGTPASGTLTNATGLPISTGVSGLGSNVATFLGTPSSANLATAVTDDTGSGALVFATSPTLVTPALGTPASGVATNITGLPLTTGVTGTLPIANGGTAGTTKQTALASLFPSYSGKAGYAAMVNSGETDLEFGLFPGSGTVTSVGGTGTVNGITLSGTVTSIGNLTLGGTLSGVDLTSQITGTLPIGNGGTGSTSTTYCSLTANVSGTLPVSNGGTGITSLGTGIATWWGTPSSANLASAVTDETGSGSLVFATSPTLVTPVLGTPASGTLTNATGLPAAGVVGTAAILGANTFTALQTQAAGADIASATTLDLTAATGNTVIITGTTTPTAFTMTKGQQMVLIAAAAWPLTFHATTCNINGGVSYTCAAGDRLYVVKDDDDVIRVSVTKQDGTAVVAASAGPSFDAVASGAISNGDTVIINADGTVSSVAGSGASESLGADSEFESGAMRGVKGCYDTSTNRVVICYKEATDSYVVVTVGTVTGSSIAWGTETRVGSQHSSYNDICYDSNANRVVLFYTEAAAVGTDYGYAAVGTVTGGGTNTVSFGTTVAIESAAIRYPAVEFDASTNNVVFLWKQDGSPNEGEARCGTVNTSSEQIDSLGTKIEFSSAGADYLTRGCFYDPDAERVIAVFGDSSGDGWASMIENTTGTTIVEQATLEFEGGDFQYGTAAYDTSNNKGIVMWKDGADSNYMKAMVLTIVGGVTNTITAGSEVTAVSVNVTQLGSGFDQTANKVVVLFDDDPNAKGKVVTGTISGTGASATSTWDTPLSLDIAYVQYPDSIYDPDTAQSILCYVDGTDSESGHARALTVGYSDTNLTSENYIGISSAAYSNTETATIQIVGSVDDAQSSLTPGQTYYISFDGSLSLTPLDDPAVTAGTAVATTKLIVKG